jgi:uncharacterized protein (TIGR04255 family)
MKKTLPKQLRKAPIIEAVAEMRFGSSNGNLASTVLPGLLFNDLKGKYPSIQAHPSAQIPAELREQNPELRYLPTTAMVGTNSSINISGRVLAVSFSKPYPGWDVFKAAILDVWHVARNSGVLGEIERLSIKYVNLIEAPMDSNQLDLTTIKVTLDDHSVTNEPTSIRSELREDRYLKVVNVVTHAQMLTADASSGLIVDIDIICNGPFANSWGEVEDLLEDAHRIEKSVFFGLLKESTIERYEPEY